MGGGPGGGGRCGGDLLQGGADGRRAVDAVQVLGPQEVFEGEADTGDEGQPGAQDVRVGRGLGERGEDRVGGEAAYDRAAHRRVRRRVRAVRVHVAVPGEQAVAEGRRGGGEAGEGGEVVQEGCGGAEVGVGVIAGMPSAVQVRLASSSARMRAARCGGANSTPRGVARPRALAITAMPSSPAGSAYGVSCAPCHAWPGSQAGTGRRRLASARAGTWPATRCRVPPAVSAAWTTLTGSDQASRARSRSATVRERRRGGGR